MKHSKGPNSCTALTICIGTAIFVDWMLELFKRHSFCPLRICLFSISLPVASMTSVDLCHRSQHAEDGFRTLFDLKGTEHWVVPLEKPRFIRAKMAVVITACFCRKITCNVTAIMVILTCQTECRTNPKDIFLIALEKSSYKTFGKDLSP